VRLSSEIELELEWGKLGTEFANLVPSLFLEPSSLTVKEKDTCMLYEEEDTYIKAYSSSSKRPGPLSWNTVLKCVCVECLIGKQKKPVTVLYNFGHLFVDLDCLVWP